MQAHRQAAVFDQSTFGKILVVGPDAQSFMDRVCTNNMKRSPGKVIYTSMLNDNGGIESDMTVMRLNNESYRLFVGTAAIKKDMAWLQRHIEIKERVSLVDETNHYAVLGLMGPESTDIARQLNLNELNVLPYFCHGKFNVNDMEIRAARLSYVGEAGWEITCKVEQAAQIYKLLADCGAKPAGLFAQTSMRIEKRFLAYGHELDSDISPLDAGLEFAIDWDKNFIGHDALIQRQQHGNHKKIVSLLLSDIHAVPIGGEPVYVDNKIIGKTTSACFGYRLGHPLALAIISTEEWHKNEMLAIDIAGNKTPAKVLMRAAHDPDGTSMKLTGKSISG